mmetsp:Transcript_28745/g.86279  ORF Transcript_28745/g.86279 Transcript_28745/m.86279 type:complete len:219 (+) Transcript_28745:1403-2059(+)
MGLARPSCIRILDRILACSKWNSSSFSIHCRKCSSSFSRCNRSFSSSIARISCSFSSRRFFTFSSSVRFSLASCVARRSCSAKETPSCSPFSRFLCHTNLSSRLLSPNGLSLLVYPAKRSRSSAAFFSRTAFFAAFFASRRAIFSSGVSWAFSSTFSRFRRSFSLSFSFFNFFSSFLLIRARSGGAGDRRGEAAAAAASGATSLPGLLCRRSHPRSSS